MVSFLKLFKILSAFLNKKACKLDASMQTLNLNYKIYSDAFPKDNLVIKCYKQSETTLHTILFWNHVTTEYSRY